AAWDREKLRPRPARHSGRRERAPAAQVSHGAGRWRAPAPCPARRADRAMIGLRPSARHPERSAAPSAIESAERYSWCRRESLLRKVRAYAGARATPVAGAAFVPEADEPSFRRAINFQSAWLRVRFRNR